MVEFIFVRVENIVGKGENAGYQHFLLFPQCLQKAALKAVKICDCLVKGYNKKKKKKKKKKKMCLWNTNAPKTAIFWEMQPIYLTLTFADDLDLGTSRCVLMRYAFITNMSFVSKLVKE